MEWLEIIKLIGFIFTFMVGTAIPFIIALVKAVKARRKAQTEAEKEKANSDLLTLANQLVQSAETVYADFNTYMKAKGLTAGSTKKVKVLTELKAYALEKGYMFNAEEWSEKIDEIVSLTRNVNAKK